MFSIRSLRAKTVLSALIPTALVMVVVAIIARYAYERAARDLVQQRDIELARVSAARLSEALSRYSRTLKDTAAEDDVQSMQPTRLSSALEKAQHRLYVFDAGVVVYNGEGVAIWSQPFAVERLRADFSIPSEFDKVRDTLQPVFSDVFEDVISGEDVILVGVPVVGSGGEFKGVLAGMFRMKYPVLGAIYADVLQLKVGRSGYAYLVDGHGQVIYHPDGSQVGRNLAATLPVMRATRGETGAVFTKDLTGESIISGFAPVPGTGWGLIIQERWAAVVGPIRGYSELLLGLLVVGGAISGGLMSFAIGRTLKPIKDLIQGAECIAGGDFDYAIVAKTGDEIQALAQQFNTMASALKASYTDLERRVADRTKELAALNAIAAAVSQSLDLEEVLNDALDKTLQVTGIEAGGIYLMDEEAGVLTIAAHRGFSPDFLREIDGLRVGEGFSGRVAQSGQPLVVRDVSNDPRLTRMVVREEGLHSLAIVPLGSKGKVLGTLFAITQGYREFTDQDVQLLTSIGHQIGVAIENVQLFEAEQRRAEQFRVISEVNRRTTSILAIEELLNQMAGLIQEAFNYYLVEIGLVEEDEVVFKARAGRNCDSQFERFRLKVGEGSITGWVAATGEPLLVPDVSQEPRYVKVTDTETRSELAVPIKVQEKVTGVINIESDRLDTFDESDVAVLQSLADQAAIAIENARLFKAEERRAEQFRVIGEVGRRITSILAVDELLGEIARLLKESLGYYLVGIGLIEGDELIFRAGAGAVWETPGFQPPRLKVGQEGITGWVAQSGEPLLVPDVSQEPRYYSIPQASEIRSELAVPLKAKEAVIGVLHVQSDRLDAFDESDLAVLQSLAHQAAIAIENARLFAQAEQRMRELEALYRAEEELNRAEEELYRRLRLDQVLQALVNVAVDLLQADKSSLMMWDAQRERLVVGAARGFSPKTLAQMSFAPGEGIVGRVAASGEPMVVEDTRTDPRVTRRFTEPEGICSFMHVPIKIGGQVFGVFNVNYAQPRAFSGGELRLCLALAQRAALAIENARLYEQARQVATLEERQRLARELHDSVTQALYGVTLYAEAAARLLSSGEVGLAADHLRELRDTAQEALREMRLLIFELRPPVLRTQGLVAALQARLEAVEGRAGLEAEFKVEGEGRLPLEIEEELYRIAQEALNNALKHAQAHSITVSLRRDQQTVILEIADDGIGFDPTTAQEHGGLGLRGMEERAAQLGGRLTVKSRPGEGTTIRVEVDR